jgi:hypothetical protein
MKKMVIGDTYIYSGRGFCHTAIRKIRDGGIIELGYSSLDADQQWIEVLENDFFIGFINSGTKLVDLNDYCLVMENNLCCYEKPDINSEVKICLERSDKIYLISKLFNKGQLWLKVYDRHGFCCYIEANSYICPNLFIPYETTLAESTIMYTVSNKKGIFKTIRLNKKNTIYVKRRIAYNFATGLDINTDLVFNVSSLRYINNKKYLDYLFTAEEQYFLFDSNTIDNLGYFDDIWLEIYARGLTGYIPIITKTNNTPYIDNLPIEHFVSDSDICEFHTNNKLAMPGLIAIILGTIIFSLFPALSVFAFYFWTLGICLIILKYFCT